MLSILWWIGFVCSWNTCQYVSHLTLPYINCCVWFISVNRRTSWNVQRKHVRCLLVLALSKYRVSAALSVRRKVTRGQQPCVRHLHKGEPGGKASYLNCSLVCLLCYLSVLQHRLWLRPVSFVNGVKGKLCPPPSPTPSITLPYMFCIFFIVLHAHLYISLESAVSSCRKIVWLSVCCFGCLSVIFGCLSACAFIYHFPTPYPTLWPLGSSLSYENIGFRSWHPNI